MNTQKEWVMKFTECRFLKNTTKIISLSTKLLMQLTLTTVQLFLRLKFNLNLILRNQSLDLIQTSLFSQSGIPITIVCTLFVKMLMQLKIFRHQRCKMKNMKDFFNNLEKEMMIHNVAINVMFQIQMRRINWIFLLLISETLKKRTICKEMKLMSLNP